jgi:hypothetical protein
MAEPNVSCYVGVIASFRSIASKISFEEYLRQNEDLNLVMRYSRF